MDVTDISWLFAFIPEKWRPWLALVLLAAYLITKLRSMQKSQVISTMTALMGTKEFGKSKSRLSKLADLLL